MQTLNVVCDQQDCCHSGMDAVWDCMDWEDREKCEGNRVQGDGGGMELGDLEMMPLEANLVSLRDAVYCIVVTIDRYRLPVCRTLL